MLITFDVYFDNVQALLTKSKILINATAILLSTMCKPFSQVSWCVCIKQILCCLNWADYTIPTTKFQDDQAMIKDIQYGCRQPFRIVDDRRFHVVWIQHTTKPPKTKIQDNRSMFVKSNMAAGSHFGLSMTQFFMSFSFAIQRNPPKPNFIEIGILFLKQEVAAAILDFRSFNKSLLSIMQYN